MNIKLAKVEDEQAKVKSQSEVINLKCFDAFLGDCVSVHAHAHNRRVACNEELEIEC